MDGWIDGRKRIKVQRQVDDSNRRLLNTTTTVLHYIRMEWSRSIRVAASFVRFTDFRPKQPKTGKASGESVYSVYEPTMSSIIIKEKREIGIVMVIL